MYYTHVRLAGLNTIDLAIQDAEYDDVFVCKGLDGLGPSDVDVTIAKGLNGGGYFSGKVPQNKQIIARIGLNPTWNAIGNTASDLRELLYGMLTGGYTGDSVAIILMDIDPDTLVETEVCRIYGYTSKFEIVPFSKDPQVQITVECLSPYFEAPDTVVEDMTGVTTNPTVVNAGNGPTGFHFEAVVDNSGAYWSIYKMGMDSWIQFEFAFLASDHIEFDTTEGNRFATLTRGATIVNLLAYLTSDSDWIQLFGGTNVFSIGDAGVSSITDFSYKPKFWGV